MPEIYPNVATIHGLKSLISDINFQPESVFEDPFVDLNDGEVEGLLILQNRFRSLFGWSMRCANIEQSLNYTKNKKHTRKKRVVKKTKAGRNNDREELNVIQEALSENTEDSS